MIYNYTSLHTVHVGGTFQSNAVITCACKVLLNQAHGWNYWIYYQTL